MCLLRRVRTAYSRVRATDPTSAVQSQEHVQERFTAANFDEDNFDDGAPVVGSSSDYASGVAGVAASVTKAFADTTAAKKKHDSRRVGGGLPSPSCTRNSAEAGTGFAPVTAVVARLRDDEEGATGSHGIGKDKVGIFFCASVCMCVSCLEWLLHSCRLQQPHFHFLVSPQLQLCVPTLGGAHRLLS